MYVHKHSGLSNGLSLVWGQLSSWSQVTNSNSIPESHGLCLKLKAFYPLRLCSGFSLLNVCGLFHVPHYSSDSSCQTPLMLAVCILVIYNTALLGKECISLAIKGVVVQVETCLNKSESKLGCNEGWYLSIRSERSENFHFTHQKPV